MLLGVSSWLSDEGQEWFQAGMSLVACALVVQMVIWMKRHGRTLKRELEGGARASIERDNWWGLLVLVMIAVAREGSETVVFLYGTVAAAAGQAGDAALLVLAGAAGFLIALLTFWLLQLGGKLITWRRFFRVTEILLLLLAGALLVGGLDHLISLDVLPTLIDPVWDSSWLLDDSSRVGKGPGRFRRLSRLSGLDLGIAVAGLLAGGMAAAAPRRWRSGGFGAFGRLRIPRRRATT